LKSWQKDFILAQYFRRVSMGNSQILLLVLTMIIVGVAVSVALMLMRENAVTANRDAIAIDLVQIATRAQQYFNRSTSTGGGSRSYIGLTADSLGLSKLISTGFMTNGNGHYSIRTAGTASQVVIEGMGNVELSDGSFPIIVCVVRPDKATITIEN
jgi:hypothetical protein